LGTGVDELTATKKQEDSTANNEIPTHHTMPHVDSNRATDTLHMGVGVVMNEIVYAEIDRIANKIWHFRSLYDLDGIAETDKGIAQDLWHRGIRRNGQVARALKEIFHDELQDVLLVEEAEIIKEKNS